MSEDTTQPLAETSDDQTLKLGDGLEDQTLKLGDGLEDQTLKLGDGFDEALIGATIVGHYVYSLNKLQALAMKQMSIGVEQAQQFVAHQAIYLMQTHGPNSPVFVDDWAVSQKSDAPAPMSEVILTDAPAPKPDNVILIPGVTHGAVKGFMAPDEIHS
jgi:hypothetical protein